MKKTPHLSRQSLEEELSGCVLPIVKGKIPEWLNGTLIRNGPSKFEAGNQQVYHWFDGLAMLHGFSFNQGLVTYSNRFLRTDAYRQVFDNNSIHYQGFASDPCRSLFNKMTTIFFPSSEHTIPNANVNVSKFEKSFVALTEIPLPVEFDLKTLKTVGVFLYEDNLPKDNCWEAAHPHIDDQRQEIISYLLKFGYNSSYVVYRMRKNSKEREIIAEIPVARPSYMHSFSVTKNYIVFTEYPFVVNPLSMLLKAKKFIQNYVWKPELGTQFTAIRRDTGEIVAQAKTSAFFAFHHVNAFEEDDCVILDLVSYPDASIIHALADFGYGNKNASFPQSQVQRYRFNLNHKTIDNSLVIDLPLELPRIHSPKYDGKPYRYFYGPDLNEVFDRNDSRCLYKVDVSTGEKREWSESGCYPGEAVFVASPDNLTDGKEDCGVILSVVLNENKGRSFLLVLDGQSFQEIGRAEIPHPIPSGLHGQYFQ